jgi:hypothetical protein
MRDPESVREQLVREWLRLADADLRYADMGAVEQRLSRKNDPEADG